MCQPYKRQERRAKLSKTHKCVETIYPQPKSKDMVIT